MGRQVEYRGKLTPVLGITDALPYSTFTGLLPGVGASTPTGSRTIGARARGWKSNGSQPAAGVP